VIAIYVLNFIAMATWVGHGIMYDV